MVSKKVSVSVSKKIGIGKSIGIGFGKKWYRKSIDIGGEGRFPETFFVTPALNCNCGFSEN